VSVSFGVVQFPGSCDERDALAACGRAGEARLLWQDETSLEGIDAVVVPGGFSYGDYLRSGAIARFAPVMAAVGEAADRGMPVLGICNGFQVLCEAGLLPGALLRNESLRFGCRQLDILVETTRTAWTSECEEGEELSIPVKHGEGRYFHPDPDSLVKRGQVAFRYGPGQNPNGSVADIAGVCNEAGNVVGLMPHPEHAVDELFGSADALKVFRSVAGAVLA